MNIFLSLKKKYDIRSYKYIFIYSLFKIRTRLKNVRKNYLIDTIYLVRNKKYDILNTIKSDISQVSYISLIYNDKTYFDFLKDMPRTFLYPLLGSNLSYIKYYQSKYISNQYDYCTWNYCIIKYYHKYYPNIKIINSIRCAEYTDDLSLVKYVKNNFNDDDTSTSYGFRKSIINIDKFCKTKHSKSCYDVHRNSDNVCMLII